MDSGYCSGYFETIQFPSEFSIYGKSRAETIHSFISQLGITLSHRELTAECKLMSLLRMQPEVNCCPMEGRGYKSLMLMTKVGTILKAHPNSRAPHRIDWVLHCHHIVGQSFPSICEFLTSLLVHVPKALHNKASYLNPPFHCLFHVIQLCLEWTLKCGFKYGSFANVLNIYKSI